MNWKNEKRKLKDLLPYEKNPRLLSQKQKKDIEKSLKKFNLVEVPVINKDDKIIAGHQRIKILMELYGGDYEIDVRVPTELLNEKDYEEYLLRSNRNNGEWDWDKIELFDRDILIDSGFDSFEIDVDSINLKALFADMDQVKKKIKVGKCAYCDAPLTLDVRYIIKDKTFENFNFPQTGDFVKLVYEKLKDILGDKKINIIIEE